MCIRICIFNLKNKQTKKEEKRVSVKNLTIYNDIFCEFAMCTFNLLLVVSLVSLPAVYINLL